MDEIQTEVMEAHLKHTLKVPQEAEVDEERLNMLMSSRWTAKNKGNLSHTMMKAEVPAKKKRNTVYKQ